MLIDVYNQGKSIIVTVNRFDEINPVCQKLGLIMDKELVKFGDKDEVLNNSEVKQLTHYEKLPKIYSLPEVPEDCRDTIDRSIPIAVLKDVTVQYEDHVILNKLNWTINPYEHWQISGPNGCGKSTLLSLISVIIGDVSEKERAAHSKELLRYGMRFYEPYTAFKQGQVLATKEVRLGDKDTLSIGTASDVSLVVPVNSVNRMKAEYSLDQKNLVAPIQKGTKIGVLNLPQ